MSIAIAIIKGTQKAVGLGHIGIFTSMDLAYLSGKNLDSQFTRNLSKITKKGVLEKVCNNLFINPSLPPTSKHILFKIAKIIRWDEFIYVSLESQLSYLGEISQTMINRVTIMTNGRSYLQNTKYGVIEFTHTSRKIGKIKNDLYFDSDLGGFRAAKKRAIQDLKRVGRNLHMLDEVGDA